MPKIEIYTTKICPYCKRAKALLKQLDAPFEEFVISGDQALTEEMMSRSGRRTVPQVFIDGQHIGGSDDLAAAHRSGELEQLLKA